MFNKKTFFCIFLSVLFGVLCFFSGYLAGENSKNVPVDTDILQANSTELDKNNATAASENDIIENIDKKEQFVLKNENDILNLYSLSDNDRQIIKSIPFNSSFLPTNDRIKLENGIFLDTVEEGFALIEDFTS